MFSPWLIPLYVLGVLLLLVLVLTLLGRVAGGKYLRPIMQLLMRLPIVGKGLRKASAAALEKQNPELASAVRKLERMNATRDPQRAQQALSRLSAAERRAYLEAAEQQDAVPEPMNRAQRRQMAKTRKSR
ncbi:MAG: hypothetical protein M3229_05460 [Actinomycetota bacterium]|nr:hypothetical protein [Actinomycetota bacterium]